MCGMWTIEDTKSMVSGSARSSNQDLMKKRVLDAIVQSAFGTNNGRELLETFTNREAGKDHEKRASHGGRFYAKASLCNNAKIRTARGKLLQVK